MAKKILNQDPSVNFEDLRRKIFEDIKDVSYFIKNAFLSLKRDSSKSEKISKIEQNFQDRIK